MSSIGAGVNEIRVHVEGEHRVLYVAKFEDAIYVLHAFRKTTRKAPKPVLELAGERYRAVLEERKGVKKR